MLTDIQMLCRMFIIESYCAVILCDIRLRRSCLLCKIFKMMNFLQLLPYQGCPGNLEAHWLGFTHASCYAIGWISHRLSITQLVRFHTHFLLTDISGFAHLIRLMGFTETSCYPTRQVSPCYLNGQVPQILLII